MRKNVHNTSGIRVHITGAFRNYGKNGAPMEEYFGKKLRTHQSEMDEGCHHCKKIRLSADHKRIWEKSGAGEKACAKCRTGTVWNDITVGAGPDGIRKLENIHHPQLKLTAEAVKKKEKAGYQENILQELLNDIVSETERKSSASKRENDLSQK